MNVWVKRPFQVKNSEGVLVKYSPYDEVDLVKRKISGSEESVFVMTDLRTQETFNFSESTAVGLFYKAHHLEVEDDNLVLFDD